MKKIQFTFQDAPDSWMGFEADFEPEKKGDYSILDENMLAILIDKVFPNIMKCNRRIKDLIIADEDGNIFKTDDFDLYGSLKKQS